MEGFHNRVARRLTCTQPHQVYIPPLPLGGSGCGGAGTGREVYCLELEHGRSVYFNVDNPGDLHRYVDYGCIAVTNLVVVTGVG